MVVFGTMYQITGFIWGNFPDSQKNEATGLILSGFTGESRGVGHGNLFKWTQKSLRADGYTPTHRASNFSKLKTIINKDMIHNFHFYQVARKRPCTKNGTNVPIQEIKVIISTWF